MTHMVQPATARLLTSQGLPGQHGEGSYPSMFRYELCHFVPACAVSNLIRQSRVVRLTEVQVAIARGTSCAVDPLSNVSTPRCQNAPAIGIPPHLQRRTTSVVSQIPIVPFRYGCKPFSGSSTRSCHRIGGVPIHNIVDLGI